MNEVFYSINVDGHVIKLEKNDFGFCVDIDWGDKNSVYSHEDLKMARRTFEGVLLILWIKQMEKED